MAHIFLRFAVVTFCMCLAVLGGCLGKGTQETARFYVLTSMSGSGAETKTAMARDDATIGVGPVELPGYLDRPQIATRESRNELQFAEFDRWAGSLEKGFSSVLAENLSILLSTDRVAVYPWKTTPIDYQVTVNVSRFDGEPGGDVLLIARWTILGDNGKEVIFDSRSSLSEEASEDDYDAIVSAQSRLLEALSREIATAIEADLNKAGMESKFTITES